MGSILNIKKGLALTLCLTIFASNMFFISQAFAQTDELGNGDLGYDKDALNDALNNQNPDADWISTNTSSNRSDINTDNRTDGSGWTNTSDDDFINDVNNRDNNTQTTVDWLLRDAPEGIDTNNVTNYGGELTTIGDVTDVENFYSDTQAGQAVAGSGIKDSSQQVEDSSVGEVASCAFGATLGTAVSAALQQAATKILAEFAIRTGINKTTSFVKVPVLDNAVIREQQRTNNIAGNLEGKETGLSIFGIPILPSWDAIGYCIVNTMIRYISESTIRWINSGFRGNPAFIENFDQFFADLANREVAIFLSEVASTDLLCGDLQVDVQRSILDRYNSNYLSGGSRTGSASGYGSCTFDQRTYTPQGGGITSDGGGSQAGGSGVTNGGGGTQISLAAYSSGDTSTAITGGWEALSMLARPENNIIGATIQANRALDAQIADVTESVRTQVVDVNGGNLSSKDSRGNIVTPGAIIEQRLNNQLDLPSDRLILADEFNEVVTQLINQLIKIALDETLGRVNGGLRAVQEDYEGRLRELSQGE